MIRYKGQNMKTGGGRRKSVFGRRSPVSLGKRLLHDTSGQVLLFGAIMVVAILAFLLMIPNGTQVTTQKVRAQTAADAGAFTGSVWLARALNLDANMNIGMKSVYTWMTVLTMGEALGQALYSDSLDPSVRAMGQGITLALFGDNSPPNTHLIEYPIAVAKLDTTARWLYSLQDDVSASFAEVAARLGTEEACSNVGGSPTSQTAGGRAIVQTNDSIPLLDTSAAGDSLMYADLLTLGPALDTIPTNDANIGSATGQIVIDKNTYDVRAYYGDSSQWYDVRQVLYGKYSKSIIQTFSKIPSMCVQPEDSGIEYFKSATDPRIPAYQSGDSWTEWVYACHEVGKHTPFIWPNTKPNPPYKDSPPWHLVAISPGPSNVYKRDTCWVTKHRVNKSDPSFKQWKYTYPSTGLILDASKPYVDSGDVVESSVVTCSGYYTGAESTVGHKGARVQPRRVNPDREFQTVSYVWRLGSATDSPFGLGPAMGGKLFPRSRVAAPSPMLAFARSEPYLTGGDSYYIRQIFSKPLYCHTYDTAYKYFDSTGGKTYAAYLKGDSWIAPFAYPPWTLVTCDSGTSKSNEQPYFFAPAWDVRLTPLDSTGVVEITSDTAYPSHSHNSFNLEDLRKYVLLP